MTRLIVTVLSQGFLFFFSHSGSKTKFKLCTFKSLVCSSPESLLIARFDENVSVYSQTN